MGAGRMGVLHFKPAIAAAEHYERLSREFERAAWFPWCSPPSDRSLEWTAGEE
jgi:hypothetical protein